MFDQRNVNTRTWDLIQEIIRRASNPEIKRIVIDGFCGLGGVTAGFSMLPDWIVIACINHWGVAIDTHEKNFPYCLHLQEDFRTANLEAIKYMIFQIKRNNPGIEVHLWLSLECTNFSNAKGGMSRDADSRTLADYVDRYVIELNPDVIWIENVKEFLLWGPMLPKVVVQHGKRKKQIRFDPDTDSPAIFNKYIENGIYPYCPLTPRRKKWMIPDPLRMGEDFKKWQKLICSFGYQSVQKLMNCADYGVPQHRVRLIMQFTRKGVYAIWPKKTHCKSGVGLPKWLPVKNCLDLEDEGDGVLTFKMEKGKMVPRIKSEATINRLIAGCLKHVIGKNDSNWIVKTNSSCNNTDANKGSSIDSPAPTVTCFNGNYLASAHFMAQSYSGNDNSKVPGINQPSRAITGTGGNLSIVKAQLLDHYYGNGYVNSVEQPAGATRTKDGTALHTVQFIDGQFGSPHIKNIREPAAALMGNPKQNFVSISHFMDAQYSSGQQNRSIEQPSGAIVSNPKNKLVEVGHFVMDTQYNHIGHSINEVAKTQTANRKHYYLVNFQWFNQGFKDLNEPSNTIIPRMDKAPNYLIVLETGELAIEVYDYDPPHYKKMKKFMAEHGIVSVNMRMLKETELLKIMTIPDETKLSKSSTANKKMIGNAVPSEFVKKLGEAYHNVELLELETA